MTAPPTWARNDLEDVAAMLADDGRLTEANTIERALAGLDAHSETGLRAALLDVFALMPPERMHLIRPATNAVLDVLFAEEAAEREAAQ